MQAFFDRGVEMKSGESGVAVLEATELALVNTDSGRREDSYLSTENDKSTFEVKERWEGAVEEVFDSYFVATAHNLLTDDVATVEIELEDLSRSDLELVSPGALFFWYIGYDQYRNGDRAKVSIIVFRRAPSLATKDEDFPLSWPSESPEDSDSEF